MSLKRLEKTLQIVNLHCRTTNPKSAFFKIQVLALYRMKISGGTLEMIVFMELTVIDEYFLFHPYPAWALFTN